MEITGVVEKVRRRPTPHGSLYLTVTIDGCPLKYLHCDLPTHNIPKRGDRVTITGMPMVGFKQVNIGGVKVTIHPAEER